MSAADEKRFLNVTPRNKEMELRHGSDATTVGVTADVWSLTRPPLLSSAVPEPCRLQLEPAVYLPESAQV